MFKVVVMIVNFFALNFFFLSEKNKRLWTHSIGGDLPSVRVHRGEEMDPSVVHQGNHVLKKRKNKYNEKQIYLIV